jgi:hypothetical protein
MVTLAGTLARDPQSFRSNPTRMRRGPGRYYSRQDLFNAGSANSSGPSETNDRASNPSAHLRPDHGRPHRTTQPDEGPNGTTSSLVAAAPEPVCDPSGAQRFRYRADSVRRTSTARLSACREEPVWLGSTRYRCGRSERRNRTIRARARAGAARLAGPADLPAVAVAGSLTPACGDTRGNHQQITLREAHDGRGTLRVYVA